MKPTATKRMANGRLTLLIMLLIEDSVKSSITDASDAASGMFRSD
eukprot:CAMPEP_0170555284 /NCGR_PEP_ID=MMETSP0211-20121228/13192_1 /TAXON_ID=311385 /ORGANISM="Pseudokeronopsis sp., Strain OXSARD2" /LENGTH=44 /DNA_ID= /DNA_START= /DNA_END= /DNA_ORIENTATION=